MVTVKKIAMIGYMTHWLIVLAERMAFTFCFWCEACQPIWFIWPYRVTIMSWYIDIFVIIPFDWSYWITLILLIGHDIQTFFSLFHLIGHVIQIFTHCLVWLVMLNVHFLIVSFDWSYDRLCFTVIFSLSYQWYSDCCFKRNIFFQSFFFEVNDICNWFLQCKRNIFSQIKVTVFMSQGLLNDFWTKRKIFFSFCFWVKLIEFVTSKMSWTSNLENTFTVYKLL